MAGNHVDYGVAMEVASHEVLVRQTYKDADGVLTGCVGMTNATGHRVESRSIWQSSVSAALVSDMLLVVPWQPIVGRRTMSI